LLQTSVETRSDMNLTWQVETRSNVAHNHIGKGKESDMGKESAYWSIITTVFLS